MGLDIESYLDEYNNYISPIFGDEIPSIDSSTPKLVLDF